MRGAVGRWTSGSPLDEGGFWLWSLGRRPCPSSNLERQTGHIVKKIGFLSFGHWSQSHHSQVRTASGAPPVDRAAVAAEELGVDGAYYRVHHFAQQLGSPFPLLSAVGARTNRIEIGTAVIDMRYENPFSWSRMPGPRHDRGSAPPVGDQPGVTGTSDRRLSVFRVRAC